MIKKFFQRVSELKVENHEIPNPWGWDVEWGRAFAEGGGGGEAYLR